MEAISEEYSLFKISLRSLSYIGLNPIGSPKNFKYIGKIFTLLTLCFLSWVLYGFACEKMEVRQVTKQLQALIIGVFVSTLNNDLDYKLFLTFLDDNAYIHSVLL